MNGMLIISLSCGALSGLVAALTYALGRHDRSIR
jgi:hypothetical protein